jgi:2,3-bisphosphoglycerate-independent phosphoglycerate mutase
LSVNKVKPIVLVILDGWGIQRKKLGNAIAHANLPEITRIWKECPHTTLQASGLAVGLPQGVMGNSEVGHLNLGAGRVVVQDLVRINQSIAKSSFSRNDVLIKNLEQAKAASANIHFMGLLSDGGVHSDINHLFALLDVAKQHGLKKVWVHAFLERKRHAA